MMAYPNQLQHVQQGPQQHMQQSHPGQPNAIAMQHIHPQSSIYQQQMALTGPNMHPAMHQQALLVRQRQQAQAQAQAQLLNGTGVSNSGIAFQNPNGAVPQVRAGVLPNSMYPNSGQPGNLGAFTGAGNPQLRTFPAQMQHQLHQQQQQQQHHIAAAQYTMSQAAAQGNPHAAAMNIPQQNPGSVSLQAMQQAQLAARAAAQKSSVLRLHQFADHLSMFDPKQQQNDIAYWRRFVNDFYSQNGVMRQRLVNSQRDEDKQFEITTNLLARYYFTLFESGIQNVQMTLMQTQDRTMPNQTVLEYPKTSFIYWFDNGYHLVAKGTLRVHFNHQQMIDMLDFTTHEHTEYVKRAAMNDLLKQGSPEMIKMSPSQKSLGKRPAPRIQPQFTDDMITVFGIPSKVLQLLENAETFSQMKELITFSHAHPQLNPTAALAALAHQQQMTHQQQHLAQQQNAQQAAQGNVNGPVPRSIGPGQPGMPMQMTSSPSANDIRMGGVMSQHVGGAGGGGGGGATPSPAQNHMQAPGMVAQHSQHQHPPTSNPSSQTSTTVGSANTSPHQTNKRRRPSTVSNVKLEDPNGKGDDGSGGGGMPTAGGAMNGTAAGAAAINKIKQSPRVNKRAKLST